MWKKFELEIAKWFGTSRNIGSGKINNTDEGDPRPGDVVTPPEWSTLIECKTRKAFPLSGIYYRAEDTRQEATKENKNNWFHYERKNGSKQIYVLATDQHWMEKITMFIRQELEQCKED